MRLGTMLLGGASAEFAPEIGNGSSVIQLPEAGLLLSCSANKTNVSHRWVGVLCVATLLAAFSPAVAVADVDVDDVDKGEFVADQLIVSFSDTLSSSEKNEIHEVLGTEVVTDLGIENTVVIESPEGVDLAEIEAGYEAQDGVLYAEPNLVISLDDAVPNDSYFPSGDGSPDLWNLKNVGQNGGKSDADIDAPEAWDLLDDGAISGSPWVGISGTTVAVVDSGVDATHPDLQSSLISECYKAVSGTGALSSGCDDDNGHGTHVNGTIAASTNNGLGVSGVAPGVKVFNCKAIKEDGTGVTSDVAACINRVAERQSLYNIASLSLSLGGTAYSATLESAIDSAIAEGIFVAASAGNDGNSTLNYPAALTGVVSVAATDRNDQRASYSNMNSDVEFSAPGSSIVSTVPGGYSIASGTSMAAPHIAAAAALMSYKYGYSGATARREMIGAVDDLGVPGRDSSHGYGRLNLCKALGGSCSYGSSSEIPPTADFVVSSETIEPDSLVTVDASNSRDYDGTIVSYEWDFNEDGKVDASGKQAQVNYLFTGQREIQLTVVDDGGNSVTAKKTVAVLGDDEITESLGIKLLQSSKSMSLKKALKRGLTVSCQMDQTGICSAKLQIKAKDARRVGIKVKRSVKYVTVATGTVDIDKENKKVKLKLRFKTKFKSKLKRLKKATARLTITGEADSGVVSKVTQTVRIR